ncbi:hypothetical protein Nepgr_021742 [Nepenthes gracilis]|uniref:Uncharacterized protein n=1 Tax=Nepenthes gracilis TaxID=150966 RepID=A0AAD3SZJ6_NEPGR|nr:hypothetical protein Nepgr_021742 [Nepenthes gracilis]
MNRGGNVVLRIVAGTVVAPLALSLWADGAVTLPPGALTRHCYKKHNTCAAVEAYVQHHVRLFWSRDRSIMAKLLRLLASDCLVTMLEIDVLYYYLFSSLWLLDDSMK